MPNTSLGRWTALFGRRRSFADEILSALDVKAEWSCDGTACDVVFEALPGWLSPLWGADSNYLYLRRPEGVWRTPLPSWLDDAAIVDIWMRSPKVRELEEDDEMAGPLVAGGCLRGAGGWWDGLHEGEPRSAADLDDEHHPSKFGMSVDADELGTPLVRTAVEDDGALLVWAGSAFSRPPRFALVDGFLVATDPDTGTRVVYVLPHASAARSALDAGRLRLSYGSRWLRDFQTDVRL